MEHGGGPWREHTVITDVTQDMAIMRKETFGPIVPILRFADTGNAIAWPMIPALGYRPPSSATRPRRSRLAAGSVRAACRTTISPP